MEFKAVIGLVLVAAGAVLALFFWDREFLWFQGGPLGALLVLLGVLDLADEFRRSRGRESRGPADGGRDGTGRGGDPSGASGNGRG
ncbi:hypothetical protein O4J56_28255 [Nocardiopsis sp. RSe5-2]|uniref:Uncharacterized protein n=1 Tax=Nocardiopsis endophytica TaxID=3018445 RepID=A0ABT4UC64_9ACTN|nr:hypothetical protein [Nocardiopsis endophytica]MDA2814569.1 hypothetical protein [Nocardiopsis endophytica]